MISQEKKRKEAVWILIGSAAAVLLFIEEVFFKQSFDPIALKTQMVALFLLGVLSIVGFAYSIWFLFFKKK